MSDIGNWAYTNVATVYPVNDSNDEGYVDDGWGSTSPIKPFGEPYEIACTWFGGGEKSSNHEGMDYTPVVSFLHEDRRVKYGDLIAKGSGAKREDASMIINHIEYDGSPFDDFLLPGELTSVDYESVTGKIG